MGNAAPSRCILSITVNSEKEDKLNNSLKTVAILLAGGSGTRMMSNSPKQSMLLLGKSVLLRAVEAFDRCELIDSIVVVLRESELEFARAELTSISKNVTLVIGGSCRAESARSGFLAAEPYADYVAIHDVARPLVTPTQISEVVRTAHEFGAATAVSAVTDTVKEVNDGGFIVGTHSRDRLRKAETPQVFSTDIYRKALDHFSGDLLTVTDDNMLVEHSGVPIYAVDIGSGNIKLTVPADFRYAEFLLLEAQKNV